MVSVQWQCGTAGSLSCYGHVCFAGRVELLQAAMFAVQGISVRR